MAQKSIRLVSTANAGVLVEYGALRLLIDGIRRAPFAPFLPTPQAILSQMLEGAEDSRWRNIDYLLFTHLHPDHFDAACVAEYLSKNRVQGVFAPEWTLPAPRRGCHALALEDGAYADFTLAPDVRLRVFGSRHIGEPYADVRNLAFALTLGEKRVVFTGDGDCNAQWYLPAGRTDALFVNPLFAQHRGMGGVLEALSPAAVYIHHLPGPGKDAQAEFYRRVTARAVQKLPQGLARLFDANALYEI